MPIDYTDHANPRLEKWNELHGFDLNFTGFDCAGEIERDPYDGSVDLRCPFQPGCGLTVKDCPLRVRLAMISRAPRRMQ